MLVYFQPFFSYPYHLERSVSSFIFFCFFVFCFFFVNAFFFSFCTDTHVGIQSVQTSRSAASEQAVHCLNMFPNGFAV